MVYRGILERLGFLAFLVSRVLKGLRDRLDQQLGAVFRASLGHLAYLGPAERLASVLVAFRELKGLPASLGHPASLGRLERQPGAVLAGSLAYRGLLASQARLVALAQAVLAV